MKTRSRFFLVHLTAVLGLLLLLSGCKQGSQGKTTITDRAGTLVTISPKQPERIISTAPSNTEIIVDLGMADKLIAVDTYSAGVAGIQGDLVLIDFAYPDVERIIGLDPDIIIAAGHNQTVSGDDPFKLVKEAGIGVVYIPTSTSIEGIYEDIRFIAEVLQVTEQGAELIEPMKAEVATIAAIGASIPVKKSVYIEISPFPFIVTCGEGTYLNQMIAIIGAENIFAGEKGWFSPAVEAIIDRNPDVILTLVNYTDTPLEEIKGRAGFETINAVQRDEVYPIEANAASRPSHHVIAALWQMARAVYPEVYAEKN